MLDETHSDSKVLARLRGPYVLLIPIAFASSAAAAHFSFLGWIQLSPTNSPPARSYLAMTYDPISGKIIAFGGFDGTGAQMTYDSVIQKIVLFGGFDGTNYLGDTWL